jgi:hypothetical protein
MSTNQVETGINNQEISEVDKEQTFLTDVSESTVWTKTNSGHKCPMNLIKMLAPNYSSKLDELKDKETIDLFNYTFKYYAPKNEDGSPRAETNKMIYRFTSKAGGSGSGSKPQFRPKRTKEIFEGLFPEVQIMLAKPDSKWKLFSTHFNPTDGTVIYVLQQEETMP